MGTLIEYQRLMTEMVYINLPGPEEPLPNMTAVSCFMASLKAPDC